MVTYWGSYRHRSNLPSDNLFSVVERCVQSLALVRV
jgi:hypothetical protein